MPGLTLKASFSWVRKSMAQCKVLSSLFSKGSSQHHGSQPGLQKWPVDGHVHAGGGGAAGGPTVTCPAALNTSPRGQIRCLVLSPLRVLFQNSHSEQLSQHQQCLLHVPASHQKLQHVSLRPRGWRK